MGELKWYVLRVISGQEKKVKSYLETEIERSKLTEFIPQVLIPSEKVYEMRNGKKRVRERNFFPGYVLLSADLTNGEAYHTVNNIPGVIGFLGNNGSTASSKEPVALRQSEVNRILGKVENRPVRGKTGEAFYQRRVRESNGRSFQRLHRRCGGDI